jgi:hypothetical protein
MVEMAKLFSRNLNYINLEWDYVQKNLEKLDANNFIAEEPTLNRSRTIREFKKPKKGLVGRKSGRSGSTKPTLGRADSIGAFDFFERF